MTHPTSLTVLAVMSVLVPCLPTLGAAKCNVSTIDVQEDFDLEKFVGTWYELEWIPAYFENFTDFYTDYVEVYKVTDGGMEGTLVGRSGDKCPVKTRTYLKTDTAGKLKYKAVVYGTEYDMDYWVISTDYEDYALVWGCTKQSDGLCDEHHVWVFGRSDSVKETSLSTMTSFYDELCIAENDLVETTHDQACEIPGSGAGHVASLMSLTLGCLAVLLTFVKHL